MDEILTDAVLVAVGSELKRLGVDVGRREGPSVRVH